MGYERRQFLYSQIEKIRKRPLISYITSTRQNMSAAMAGDAIDNIIEQIRIIPDEYEELDFLIISNGGDPITALRIVSILRERFKKVTVIVPYVAYSAATILALGADDILMHPFSNLGPVDPQLSIQKNNGIGQINNLSFSSEDLRNYINFIKEDVGITDQAYLVESLKALSSEVGVIPIGSAKRSQQLSLSLSSKMLETHLSDKAKAATISKALNSSYYHHGYAVGRSEAKEIGLNIVEPEKEIEDLMWQIWEDVKQEMKCDKIFDLVSELMNNSDLSSKLTTIPVVDLPSNMPQEMSNQIWSNIVKEISITNRASLELSQLMVVVESAKIAFQFHTKFSVAYWRNPDMSLGYNVTFFNSGWELSHSNANINNNVLQEVAITNVS